MSLLQSPQKALNQIEWYLNNREFENFPGAFLIAAGNLSRQTLEQILFILAFYSGLPKSKYMNSKYRLKTADKIIKALHETDQSSGKTYIEKARIRNPRIKKFTYLSRSLDRWRKLFNEPSHFHNPASKSLTREHHIKSFVERLRTIVDEYDAHLITAAVNEIRSGGKIRAIISNTPENLPGMEFDAIVKPSNIKIIDGKLTISSSPLNVNVIPDNEEVPQRWSKVPIVVQHSKNIIIQACLINEYGEPLNLTSMENIIKSFSKTEKSRRIISRKLKQIGIKVEWHFNE